MAATLKRAGIERRAAIVRVEVAPRLGDRDDGLIAQYADIFDALPPIEINQHNELIDGWHRVRAAAHVKRTEISYIVVETESEVDLSDKMWAANLKHGVQNTRIQRQTQGLNRHGRGLKAKDFAQRVGVSTSSVYGWTKGLREREKQERDSEIARLRDEGLTQQEIADELGVAQGTIAKNIPDSKTGIRNNEPESESELTIEPVGDDEIPEMDEAPVDEEAGIWEPDVQPATDETLAAEEEPATPEPEREAPPPEQIPDDILNTARAVMGVFSETRPDAYVPRLEASGGEWMTITDDSLSNELERKLLTSAAAMCLWQEWMLWYQSENASNFTDTFGKLGPVFVRGQAGQWRIVSRLRSILRRLRA